MSKILIDMRYMYLYYEYETLKRKDNFEPFISDYCKIHSKICKNGRGQSP